jgi:hypothetical protein
VLRQVAAPQEARRRGEQLRVLGGQHPHHPAPELARRLTIIVCGRAALVTGDRHFTTA